MLVSFDLPTLQSIGLINHDTKVITLTVNETADVSSVVPTFVLDNDSTIDLVEGDPIDLTNPLTIHITTGLETVPYFVSAIKADDHTTVLSIFQMVLNRLPFVANNQKNKEILSELTYEIMYELEGCYQIGNTGTSYDSNRIGQERFYNILQKSIIADILSINTLMSAAIKTIGGDNQSATPVAPTNKYLKSAEAGSAKVGYDQLTLKDKAVLAIDTASAINSYRSDVKRKMAKINCLYEFDVPQEIVVPTFIASGKADIIF